MNPQEREFRLRQVDIAVRAGDLAGAAVLAERALALGLEHPGLLNLAAHQCVEKGQLQRAVDLLGRARKMAPRDVHVLNTLGIALKRMGRRDAAGEAFDAAIAANPNYANAHFNKGTVLEERNALDEAWAAYERAIALDPDFAEALGRLSYLAAMRGDYETAHAFGERAIKRRPDQPPAALNLAQFATLRGDYDAAKTLAKQVLARAPENPSAILLLAQAEVAAGEGASALPRLTALLENAPTDGDTRGLALSLLARIEEEAGNNKAAFAAYVESKAELQRNYAKDYVVSGGTLYAGRVARAIGYFAQAPAAQWTAQRNPTATSPGGPACHVFLVGFPRSGTTLLEKCLAGHPGIATMEEEESFAEAMNDFFFPPDGFARMANLSDAALARYRDAYWRTCRAAAPELDGKVFIDKMPLNTVLLPFVAKLFPKAKVLFALRDPRDVVMSCLKQQFAMSAAMYEFCTLEGAARLYDAVMRLAEIYREKLGLDIMDTRYEDMIADLEGAMRRICGFIGVEWDAAMRDVAANARARVIRTPSATQVVRGLYDGSGKWRRYRDEMAPVLKLLNPWVAKFGYAPE